MKKDQKYSGEVWFEEKEDEKQFAIISFKDDDLLIETNLHGSRSAHKQLKIIGIFPGVEIGYMTFIDCMIIYSSSGLTETRIYRPKYSFISGNHFIDAINTKFNEFVIVNDTIVKWVNNVTWYDREKEKLLSNQFKDNYNISESNFSVTINHYLSFASKRTELNIKNRGSVLFKTEKSVGILEAIDIYNQFQKMLQLLVGGSSKFERFSYKCLSCGEWQKIYYNDKKLTKSTDSFVHTQYDQVKVDLVKVLNAVYSNDKFQFCLDKLMENFIDKQVSHNKRFTTSIATFEAFGKLYSGHKSNNLSKFIKHYKDIFVLIGQFKEEDWKRFPNKVVRSRDYHIHSNIENKNVYSEYELLYISFLFDFVVGYLLIKSLNVSEELLNKFVMHGNNVFVNMQFTNRVLGDDPMVTSKEK